MLSKLCALSAILMLASANAALAAGTPVNIADPNGRLARVEPGSRLAVQEIEPSSFFHASGILSGSCVPIATVPNGKALIVRQVRVDTATLTAAGAGVAVFASANCNSSTRVATVHPPSLGLSTITFDPGVAIPAGSAISVDGDAQITAFVYVDAYTVSSVVAPTTGQIIQVNGTMRRQR